MVMWVMWVSGRLKKIASRLSVVLWERVRVVTGPTEIFLIDVKVRRGHLLHHFTYSRKKIYQQWGEGPGTFLMSSAKGHGQPLKFCRTSGGSGAMYAPTDTDILVNRCFPDGSDYKRRPFVKFL